jgi:hypothetical protein
MESCDVRFQWGLTAAYGNETPWQPGKRTGDAFGELITGLEPGTAYHFRAQARNSVDLASGDDMTFATLSQAVEIPKSLLDPCLKLLLEEQLV